MVARVPTSKCRSSGGASTSARLNVLSIHTTNIAAANALPAVETQSHDVTIWRQGALRAVIVTR
jgi:hypothetical protein